jgi:hypothetical protein
MASVFRGRREHGDCGRFFCETDADTDCIEMEEGRTRGRTLVIGIKDSELLPLRRRRLATAQAENHGWIFERFLRSEIGQYTTEPVSENWEKIRFAVLKAEVMAGEQGAEVASLNLDEARRQESGAKAMEAAAVAEYPVPTSARGIEQKLWS